MSLFNKFINKNQSDSGWEDAPDAWDQKEDNKTTKSTV